MAAQGADVNSTGGDGGAAVDNLTLGGGGGGGDAGAGNATATDAAAQLSTWEAAQTAALHDEFAHLSAEQRGNLTEGQWVEQRRELVDEMNHSLFVFWLVMVRAGRGGGGSVHACVRMRAGGLTRICPRPIPHARPALHPHLPPPRVHACRSASSSPRPAWWPGASATAAPTSWPRWRGCGWCPPSSRSSSTFGASWLCGPPTLLSPPTTSGPAPSASWTRPRPSGCVALRGCARVWGGRVWGGGHARAQCARLHAWAPDSLPHPHTRPTPTHPPPPTPPPTHPPLHPLPPPTLLLAPVL